MSDVKVDVAVVPVSVRQEGYAGRPTLVALAGEDGHWARTAARTSARDTATSILRDLLPLPSTLVDPRRLDPVPVTFIERRRSGQMFVTLLYTVALPMALTSADLNVRWVELLHPAGTAAEGRRVGKQMIQEQHAYAAELVDHWRQALEETTAGLLFLAKYWTMPQLRDAYSAVWGYEQDTASFNKWADPRGGGALRDSVVWLDEKPPHVTDEIAESLAVATELLQAGGGSGKSGRQRGTRATASAMAGWNAVATALRPGTRVGLAFGTATLAAPAIPPLALAVTAAMVAYQASTRGAPPDWYTAAPAQNPYACPLEKLYQPRPAWMSAGSGNG